MTEMLKDIDGGYIKFGNTEIRIIIDNDEKLWINAKDLAEALEYQNTKDAILTHTKEKDRIRLIDINIKNKRGQQQSIYLSEAGMYKLVTKSRMKKAELFSDWVTEEVLPSIRKYGMYKLKQNIEHEKVELLDKINCIEEEMKVLKKELKKDKYPDGGYAYAVDFSTKEKEIYRIGATDDLAERIKQYNTHNPYKREYVVTVENDCPVRLEYCVRGMLHEYRYKAQKDSYMCSLKIVEKAFNECKKAVQCMNQKGGSDLLKKMISDNKVKLKKLNRKINQLDKKLNA